MSEVICFVSLISKENSPLYITQTTPSPDDNSKQLNEFLKYNFLSHMALDIFESPFIESLKLDNDNLLLFAQDGISVYGYETNTGLKIVIGTESKQNMSETLYPIFRKIHKLYLKIVCNPFSAVAMTAGVLATEFNLNEPIDNERFDQELKLVIKSYNDENALGKS